MKREIYYCDRCKTQIGDDFEKVNQLFQYTKIKSVRFMFIESNKKINSKYQLCNNCYDSFLKWCEEFL